ncbi:hypothetical protein EZV62_004396 [Acer yangbiense]|uniref:Sulfotransferase n=1 Tax=Acer yangbiense TaxID=1000413 RepID=A0A5C7IJU2_9ROSI|nr:hypothetical protein EZV62_004396 [Acer yangbiense]
MEKSQSLAGEFGVSDEIEELLLTLPRDKTFDGSSIYQYEGAWYRPISLAGLISSRKHFQAKDSDVIVITFLKSGTTWLKALTYAIVHRSHHAIFDSNSPLLTTNSHDLVPFLDFAYDPNNNNSSEHLSSDDPRIFGTHIPYSSLPDSIKNSDCRIVYMCRNPFDQFISHWKFLQNIAQEQNVQPISFEEAFELFCKGIHSFGPSWEHVLGYWKASLDNPRKILFFKYEDVKEDTSFHVNKLADFLGCPFSDVEKSRGVIEEIVKLCSFDNMKDLEVNKTGRFRGSGAKNSKTLFTALRSCSTASPLTTSLPSHPPSLPPPSVMINDHLAESVKAKLKVVDNPNPRFLKYGSLHPDPDLAHPHPLLSKDRDYHPPLVRDGDRLHLYS